MKRVMPCVLVMVLLAFAMPLGAQDTADEEGMFMLSADQEPAGPPAPPVAGQGAGRANAPGPGRGRMGGAPPGGHWGGYGMAGRLQLTPDQAARMHDLWDRYYTNTRGPRYDLMQKCLEMQKLFTDPKTDAATLRAKYKEIAAIRDRLMDMKAQAMIESRSLLTPDQIKRLDHGDGLPHGRLRMMGGGMMGGCGMMGGGMMGGAQ